MHNVTMEQDLEDKDTRLKNKHEPSTPFETLIDQVEYAVEHAAVGNLPYTKKKIVNSMHNLAFSTGTLNDYCKCWRKKIDASKT